ncbi:MAG: hypothetical protein V7739_13590 [Motiliproteus sp.]
MSTIANSQYPVPPYKTPYALNSQPQPLAEQHPPTRDNLQQHAEQIQQSKEQFNSNRRQAAMSINSHNQQQQQIDTYLAIAAENDLGEDSSLDAGELRDLNRYARQQQRLEVLTPSSQSSAPDEKKTETTATSDGIYHPIYAVA